MNPLNSCDSAPGTAADLLKSLMEKKKELVKSGDVYKRAETKPFYNISDLNDFDIPDTWCWAKLSDVSLIQEGAGIRKWQYRDNGIQILCVTNILDGEIDLLKKELYISEEEYLEKYKHLTLKKGDVVTACSGGSWGKTAIFTSESTIMLNTSTLRLRFFGDIADNTYLYYISKSRLFKQQLESQLSGMQPNFGYAHYSRIMIPLPPLSEQKKIVALLDDVLSRIDKARENIKKNIENAKELYENAVEQVVSGCGEQSSHLNHHNSSTETAADLLKEIAKEREALIKAGKIKKSKPLLEITEDEIPYEIPENWEWVRLGDICKSISDGDHQPPPQTKSGIPFLVISNVSSGYLNLENTRYVSEEYFSKLSGDRVAEIGDVLFTVTGSYGIPIKVNQSIKFCFQRHIALIKGLIDLDFLYFVLKSPYIKSQCDNTATGTAQKTVGLHSLRNFLIPLPPLSEQKKIVAELDALEKQRSTLTELYTKKLQALDELRNSVLEKAFRGELTGNSTAQSVAAK